MKRSLVFAASAFGLGAAALSSAQAIDATPSGISVRGGVIIAIDEELREVQNLWGGLGLDYTFDKQYMRGSETYISLDWIFHRWGGDKGTFWPLMLGQKFYRGGNDLGEERMYFNVGLGAVFFDIGQSDTVFGGKVGLGKEFGPNIFGEATLYLSEENKFGFNAASIAFWLGYRF
jgi:hypothetical protein